ncbi:MAG TPA: DUF1775 domain-containing protein [Solirubrobacter sp.]|nr:DUF1775 domain-containing protein [Solirubrobacter sp.]
MRRVLLVVLALLAWPAPALAHVTVLPETSRPGQTLDLTFRVPNERDEAATVRLDVFLPPGVPAEVPDHKGWTVSRVGDEVRWTAEDGVAIRPGRQEDFKVRLGPLPNAPRIVFKSLQHYADGQVVRWIQDSGPDDPRPAAILDLGGAKQAGGGPPWALIGAVVVVLAVAALLLVTRRRAARSAE